MEHHKTNLDVLSQHPLFQSRKDDRNINNFKELSQLQFLLNNALTSRGKVASSRLLEEIGKVESSFRDMAAIYICKAYAFAVTGQYEDAYKSLDAGLANCIERTWLCELMGDLMLEQGMVEASGWWMQSCMLGTGTPQPYLDVGVLAKHVGMDELYWRLLNAVDVMYVNIYRIDYAKEQTILSLAQKDPRGIKSALENFQSFMNDYLPPASLLPKDQKQRELFVLGEADVCKKAAARLLLRKSEKEERTAI